MILALPSDVRERLAEIERDEGIPAAELCHQAIAAWTHLRSVEERAAVGFAILQTVMYRGRSPS